MKTSFLSQIASLFKAWNIHKGRKLCIDLKESVEQEQWATAKTISAELHDYITPFRNGDSEGQHYWGQWTELKAQIDEQKIVTQLELIQ